MRMTEEQIKSNSDKISAKIKSVIGEIKDDVTLDDVDSDFKFHKKSDDNLFNDDWVKKQVVEHKQNKLNFGGLDNRLLLAETFFEHNPFFYDKNQIFWFWNKEKFCYEIVDEIDLMNMIDNSFQYNTISSKVKNEIIEALKRTGRKNIPQEPDKNLIQFRNKVFNIINQEIKDVSPKMFFTNPIPWDVGENDKTPVMDALIISWVGEKLLTTMYQLIAYCCYRDYPIHLIFCLVGNGRNGKSRYLEMINRFIGKDNVTSSELDNLLENRFETFKLYRKLVCVLGETNFGEMKKTSILKKITGQDLIGFEMKNKTPFDDYSYSKMLIASNSLPTSYDTSDGFYRRWFIIKFENEFQEGKDILNTIPQEEYNNLAKKITILLPELLDDGKFKYQGTVEQRKQNYLLNSNPLILFIEEYCKQDLDKYVSYSKLYSTYVEYLKILKQRVVSKKEFSKVLNDEAIEIKKTTRDGITDTYILGIEIIKIPQIPQITQHTLSSRIGELSRNICISGISSIIFPIKDDKPQNPLEWVKYTLSHTHQHKMYIEELLLKSKEQNILLTDELLQKGCFEGLWFGYEQGFINLI